MLFRWLKNRRRASMLAKPTPPEWEDWLAEDLPFYRFLPHDEQSKLLDLSRVFLAEKYFEGCDGFELTDRIKLSIAGQACLLLLNIEHDYYRRVRTIFVYPDTRAIETHGGAGQVSAVSGVASHDGPIVLCWDAVRGGTMHPNDGHNVVFHEFAHALDFNDHVADGTPPLGSREQFDRWVEVMTQHYEELLDSRQRRRSVLRAYGATNPAEFFAVATEAFFEKPRSMQRKLPELYDVLKDYYRQDPARWN